ncbi:MAG: hypothetical protein LC109_03185 [Bacteroidia bacterium]|nr:hypothetical protein [Bacteroidia bacterium]
MLIVSIENKEYTFNQAIEMQFEVFKLIRESGIVSHVKINKKEYVPIEDISFEFLTNKLKKDIKKDLVNPENLDSSRIGYMLFLIAKSYNMPININITFGKPKIAGRDVINISTENDHFKGYFNELVTNYYQLVKKIIELLSPNFIVVRDIDLRKIAGEERFFDFGYILYKKGEVLKDMAKEKGVKVQSFHEGHIWHCDFSTYENGFASVVETWGEQTKQTQ